MLDLSKYLTIEQIKHNAEFDLPDKGCGWLKDNECTFMGMCTQMDVCKTILVSRKWLKEVENVNNK